MVVKTDKSEDFDQALRVLPEELRAEVAHYWQQYLAASFEHGQHVPTGIPFLKALCRVWSASRFVAQACIEYPDIPGSLLDEGDLLSSRHRQELPQRLAQELEGVDSQSELKKRLRGFRRREMVRIAWRDLARWAPLDETLRDLSLLAETCLEQALTWLYERLCGELGTPKRANGKKQGLVVLGMGKLGAEELNFSSDIDLIFAYAEDGETRKRDGISHEQFFRRLGTQLIDAINEPSSDGYVFRVDMRLRPYGGSGALAVSFDAMEEYYQYQGREWERYAMIKARVVAGDREAGAELMAMLKPFVYRRYLDYGVFESLRDMHGMIQREVRRKGMADNVKLGPGGIREIEFLGQAFQLLRGGRDNALRVRGIMPVLTHLGREDYIPAYVVRSLQEAYVMLRHVENRIQAYDDKQAHALPEDGHARTRLAFSMGYPDWGSFMEVLNRYRQIVDESFYQFFAIPQVDTEGGDRELNAQLLDIWSGRLDGKQAQEKLAQIGFDDPASALSLCRGLRESRSYQVSSAHSHDLMDRLMPLLLKAVAASRQPRPALLRIVGLLERVLGRTTYLSLLLENPMALSQLVHLCAASEWIALFMTEHPILLDELLDPRSLYQPPSREWLKADLDQQLAGIDEGDLEAQMDMLRQFKQANVLRVAAGDITGGLDVMEVSSMLTMIAEVILVEVLRIAWRDMVERYGLPERGDDQSGTGFGVIAYGKMGGVELGYGSDLDLVFLHDNNIEDGHTGGRNPISNNVFYARLGQRVIHMLNTVTSAGILYEVDMRLRPSGASGLLVSSLEAFEDYQKTEAWTWEHQALVRARFVAGDETVHRHFSAVRAEVLRLGRDAGQLAKDVAEMRERMRSELGSGRSGQFNIKQDRGGVADIEFMVQYLVLREAQAHPDILQFNDNLSILQWLQQQRLMSEADSMALQDAYRSWLARLHQRTLAGVREPEPDSTGRPLRDAVIRVWDSLFGTESG